jgi:uncharacterized protein YggE
MKKITLVLILLFCAAAFAQDLPKIAVYVTGGQDEGTSAALATRLTEALVRSNRYAAIERSDAFMAEVAKEHTAQRSGDIDDNEIRKLGIQSGAQFVCVANITPTLGAYQVSARIIDIETAKVAAIGVADSPLGSIDELRKAAGDIVAGMFEGQRSDQSGGRVPPHSVM